MKLNRWTFWSGWMAASLICTGTAYAQADTEPSDTELVQAEVSAWELEPEEERERIVDEAEQGPDAEASWFQDAIDFETVERTGTAVARLSDLVSNTPAREEIRADYMFRLAELFYDNARAYESRSYEYRDQAFDLADSDPARSGIYEERASDYLSRADEYSEQAIVLYADIYEGYHDSFDDIDAVLYYLGANLLQLGENSDARIFFEELAQQYPQSTYLPQAMLLLGEVAFAEGDMGDALEYYTAVQTTAEGGIYYYATYKIAWCLYNLAQDEDDFEEGLNLLYEVAAGGDDGSTSGLRLRRDSLRDMTLFYVEVGRADRAYEFFDQIAPDMAFELTARLARIYGERGHYEDSNTLYRELIGLNSTSFDIVEYQREIVRNVRPVGSYEDIVLEVRRLVEVYTLAQGFNDVEPAQVEQSGQDIERLLRQLATTYHREADVTESDELYAFAEGLYTDYLNNFPRSDHAYTMWFYYAEIQYWHDEDWEGAATAYEHVMDMGGGTGEYDTNAALATCISYTNMMDLASFEVERLETAGEDEELPPIPVPEEIPAQMTRMMNACDLYQGDNTDETRAVEIQYAIAYTYYEHNHLDEAAERFANIAMNYFDVDPGRAEVSAELMLDSLALMRRFDDMTEWIDIYLDSPIANTAFGPRLQLLQEQVSFKACRDLMETDQSREAGDCFIAFVENHFESELVDRALFNAGITYDRVDEIDFSISAFQYLIEFRPNSDLVPDTIYGLGQTYHRLAIYSEAANYYEQYAVQDSEGEHVINALANAYQFRQGLGEFDQAIADLEEFIDASDDDDDEELRGIAEARYQIATIREQQGASDDAIESYNRFIRDYDNVLPGRALEAYVNIADIYMAAERTDRGINMYRDALDFAQSMDAEELAGLPAPARDAAAKAQFMLGEQIFAEFEAIQLVGDEEEVQAAVAEKIAIGQRATPVFDEVFTYQRPGWAICSFTRLGQMYHVFFEQIIDAPVPSGLDPLVEEQYLTLLEDQAIEMKLIAMDRYERAITLARDSGWFNDCSDQAATLLQDLDPSFRAGNEARIAPGYDSTGWYQAEFVESLIPEDEANREEEAAEEVAPPVVEEAPVEGGVEATDGESGTK